MFLEIVSPEAVLLSTEVRSVSVPGVAGYFQVLDNHAPIVSTLQNGEVTIDSDSPIELNRTKPEVRRKGSYSYFEISSGIFEVNNDKAILLID